MESSAASLRIAELSAQAAGEGRWHPHGFSECFNLILRDQGIETAISFAQGVHDGQPEEIYIAYQLARLKAFLDPVQGVDFFVRFIRMRSPTPLAHYWLARLYGDLGDHGAAKATVEQIASYAGLFPELLNVFAFHGVYEEKFEPAVHLERLQRLTRSQFGVMAQERGSVSKRPRYVIGFVCAALCKHAISDYVLPLFQHLNRKMFLLVVFSSVRTPDEVTVKLQKYSDIWYDVAKLPDKSLVELIRAEKIDILVDLDHHTADNRLAVFAQRAAPLQLTAYGLNATTGIDAMDYRLTDWLVDPAGSEGQYSEKLLRTRGSHFTYQPPVNFPAPTAPHWRLQSAGLVLGSFNSWGKLGEALVKGWAAALLRLPTAQLLLLGFDDEIARLRVQRWFLESGVESGRVEYRSRLSLSELATEIQRVDLALDSWPYGGGVTTSLTLKLGVPVLTLAGDRASARIGASAMHRLGLPEWVVHTMDELVSRLQEFEASPELIVRARGMITDRFSSVFGDGHTMAAEFEALIVRALERYRRGLPPEHDSN